MAPVIKALQKRANIITRVLLSGQHNELLSQALRVFDIKGDENLSVMRENQTLAGLTARLFEALDPILASEKPDMVIAQGDTTTVLVAAIAAFYRGIPFGHVEAGLRTGNMQLPFPEEFNRVAVGRVATLNFAPTQRSYDALVKEGVDTSAIFLTGNTVIDALLSVAKTEHEPTCLTLPKDKRIILLTMHRRENFGEPLERILDALLKLAETSPDVVFVYPVHPNPNVANRVQKTLGSHPSFILTQPLDYADLVAVMKASTLVLTDSGGLQEEAPALAKPVLVLRQETERPEAIDAGVAKLVGTATDVIVRETTRLLNDPEAYRSMARGVSPYGDGHAAERIADAVASYFQQKGIG